MKAQRIQSSDEPWFIRRLRDHGAAIPDGIAVRARRELVRAFLITRNLAEAPIGRAGEVGHFTYQLVFERLYGEPLIPAAP